LTGMLGYGELPATFPRSCYNAQKNWFLQWYQDRSLALGVTKPPSATIVSRTLPWTGDLAAFVDYNATKQPVILQISSDESDERLYCQFNRAKKFNKETREYADHLVIVEEEGSVDAPYGMQSWLVGAILPPRIRVKARPGEHMFTFDQFASQGRAVHFQVCHQVRGPVVDFLRMSIYLDGQSSGCLDTI
jgi:hypothetical protein